MMKRFCCGLLLGAYIATLPSAGATIVDAVPGDHPHWSMVTGGVYAVTWDWSWAADSATQVKVVAVGPKVRAEATLAKPATSFALELPAGDETTFDLALTFLNGTTQVAPTMTTRLYAVKSFEDDVRTPDRSGTWVYKADMLAPFDASWTNAASGATLVADNGTSGASTNFAATASWGALPLVKREFGSDVWHLALTLANGATYTADVRFDAAGLVVILK